MKSHITFHRNANTGERRQQGEPGIPQALGSGPIERPCGSITRPFHQGGGTNATAWHELRGALAGHGLGLPKLLGSACRNPCRFHPPMSEFWIVVQPRRDLSQAAARTGLWLWFPSIFFRPRNAAGAHWPWNVVLLGWRWRECDFLNWLGMSQAARWSCQRAIDYRGAGSSSLLFSGRSLQSLALKVSLSMCVFPSYIFPWVEGK